ncbi:MAG TPA: hypothetical protein VNT54_09050 [Solirubrobacteraceae bacterium]|nr:hypothetical protein [Solirubrobacteraceae bacterium]
MRDVDDDERDGAAAGAGAVANVWTGAAAGAVEPENTAWPVGEEVTVLGAFLGAGAVRDGLLLERAGAVERSAAAGVWLRATFGVLNDGALLAGCAAGAAAAGVLGCAAAAGAGAGAATENDAGAKPPVGRDAVIV